MSDRIECARCRSSLVTFNSTSAFEGFTSGGVQNVFSPDHALPPVRRASRDKRAQGVEIDYCPQCRGVWLDRGELDKIIERSNRETEPPAPPVQTYRPDRQQPHAGHEGYPRRRRSFLEDLFD